MDESTVPEHSDVVIIGGGIAGLTAGFALSERDFDVTVIEEKDILGGRARSWEDPETGDPVHVGPHILLSEYPNLLKLFEELGTDHQIDWQKEEFITILEGTDRYTKSQSSWLPAPFAFVPSQLRDDRVSREDALSSLPLLLYMLQANDEDFRRLDNHSAYGFLKSLGVRDNFIDVVWRFTCRAIMNVPLEFCSAGALLRFYQKFLGYSDFDVGFPTVGLGDLFVPGSRRRIEQNGGHVLTGRRVNSLLRDTSRVEGVRLEDGTELRADQVISSLPPQGQQSILPSDWKKSDPDFRELGYFQPCPYYSPYIWFDRKVTDRKFWARSYDFADYNLDFYDYSNIYRNRSSEESLITGNVIFSGRTGDMNDQEIIDVTIDELEENIPAVSEANVTRATVNRIPMAIHCPYPGTEQRRPDQDTAMDNFILAGDWVDTGLPSSMESAAQSGWRAAELVLEKNGQSISLTESHRDLEGLAKILQRLGQHPVSRRLRSFLPPEL